MTDSSVAASRPLRAPDPRLAPWRAFLLAHGRVWRRLDEDLRVEHGLSLSEYHALLLLAEADGRLRMRVLADELELSKSGVTRLVDRLIGDGLVDRGACTTDARGAEAILSPAGLERLRAAAPTHLHGIQAYFLDAIPDAELARLEATMLAVAGRLPAASCARPGTIERAEERCGPHASSTPAGRTPASRSGPHGAR